MQNIAISNDIYNNALAYARSRKTTISVIVEDYLKRLSPSIITRKEAEMKLDHLLGLTRGLNVSPDDINGDVERTDYLKEKYGL